MTNEDAFKQGQLDKWRGLGPANNTNLPPHVRDGYGTGYGS